jgi:phospholipid/cholesterol/gamma-HCH transport system substrate-binding protein
MENKSSSYRIKLGMFVSIGLAIFIFAIFWIGKQKHLFNQTFSLSAVFTSVSGLQVGNNVRFSGINIGTVDKVEILNDTSVKVEFILDQSVQRFIKKDSYATIGSEGLMGDRIISVTQGTPQSESVKNGDVVRSLDPVETDEIMANLKVTTDNTAVLTDQLAEIMIKINSGRGTLGRLIEDSTIADQFEKTIENLKDGTKGFSDNMEAAQHNFLLKGFFKRKQKEQDKIKRDKEKAIEKEKERQENLRKKQ